MHTLTAIMKLETVGDAGGDEQQLIKPYVQFLKFIYNID